MITEQNVMFNFLMMFETIQVVFISSVLVSTPSMILLDIKLWVINVIGCATYNI